MVAWNRNHKKNIQIERRNKRHRAVIMAGCLIRAVDLEIRYQKRIDQLIIEIRSISGLSDSDVMDRAMEQVSKRPIRLVDYLESWRDRLMREGAADGV